MQGEHAEQHHVARAEVGGNDPRIRVVGQHLERVGEAESVERTNGSSALASKDTG